MKRRGFLFGMGSLLATPAIVRVSSLMPVKVVQTGEWVFDYTPHMQAVWRPGPGGYLECVMEPFGGAAGYWARALKPEDLEPIARIKEEGGFTRFLPSA